MADNKKISADNTAAQNSNSGLGVWALAAIVVSSMIGGGIYSLPQNMAAGASAGAVLLAWVITGIGVYFIANTFRILSAAKPDLKAGCIAAPVLVLMSVLPSGGRIGCVKFAEMSAMPLLQWTH